MSGEDLGGPDSATEVLSDFVDTEYGYEWQRKQSLETRCIAIVTADVALLTVAVLMGDRLGLLVQLNTGICRNAGIASLCSACLSILAAVIASIPLRYPALGAETINRLIDQVETLPESDEVYTYSLGDDVLMQLVRSKVAQLRVAKKSNGVKAVFTFISFLGLISVISSLSLALGTALDFGSLLGP